MDSKQSHHVVVCPYAATLSDDEDAGSTSSDHHAPHADNNSALDALSAARQKCPAFANNAPCPFREAGADPNSLREVMKTVPPSHFVGSEVLQKLVSKSSEDGTGEAKGGGSVATQFQKAMEHVHQVSTWLESSSSGNENNEPTHDQPDKESNASKLRRSSSHQSFIIKGGCPFKSFHKSHSSESNEHTSKKLARAMEDFSLAAIMGRMASQSFEDGEDLLGDDDEEEEGGEDVAVSTLDQEKSDEETTSSAKEIEQQQRSVTPSPQKQQLKTVMRPSKRRASGLLSEALKTGTAESHTAAENVHFVNNFIQGKIDRDLYTEMVTGLYHTYVVLEKLLEEHAPKYFPTLHFPKELARTQALEEDMEYWHGINWKSKHECNTPSPAVQDYVQRMNEVGKLDPLLLLSHAYTRYLGDLSGGKVLSRIARRALNLGKGYDCGLQFYNFENVPSAKLFKDEYRQALDELVLEPSEIGKLVAEANVAFALNMRVFEELDVKGGVEGARVRNVEEALAYYDIEMEGQKTGNGGWANRVEEDEAKCPFGFVGGPNPHDFGKGTKKNSGGSVTSDLKQPKASAQVAPSKDTTALKKEHSSGEKGGRCPWPFVFFHDPVMGMKDWQTWFVIGIVMCWVWSCFQQ